MAKSKPKATVLIGDGAEGTAKVTDRRFEKGEWPIQFTVHKEQADTWLRYFYAECQRRGWSSSSLSQMEARENSGSITVNTGGAGSAQLDVVWERRRQGPISVRSRSTGDAPGLGIVEVSELFERVNEGCRSGAKHRIYCRGQLEYDGLPWRGEFWLDETLRLGPPSRQYETALLGPRVIMVDGLADCVGPANAGSVFSVQLRELSTFLSVVMNTCVQIPERGQVWTWTDGADCAVRQLGYVEHDNPREMPARGEYRSVPLRQLARPDFSLRGIDGSITEESLPSDISDLWMSYRTLAPHLSQRFLQAAAKWQEALKLSRFRSTLSFALMVVACEALKPPGREFREHNIYHVVEALLGKTVADKLREPWLQPQDVRTEHLHLGKFRSSEFMETALTQSYQDPTFDQALRALALIAQESIIEWLRRQGAFVLPPTKRTKSQRR